MRKAGLKLIVEVWTNGSISPKKSISRAGKILRDHLAIFLDYPDIEKFLPINEQESGYFGPTPQNSQIVNRKLRYIGNNDILILYA